MPQPKTYTLAGSTYEQRELVLGQWRQLQALLTDLQIPTGPSLMHRLAAGLEHAGRLDRALAIILVEVGKSPQHKDLAALEAAIANEITPRQIAEIIEDFFTCNPVSSILSRLGTVLAQVVLLLSAAMKEIGSTGSLSPLPVATLPEETPLSGESHPVNPFPGSEQETAS